jgi:hypothetical protein
LLLLLALGLWRRRGAALATSAVVTPSQAFVTTLRNPKAIVFALGIAVAGKSADGRADAKRFSVNYSARRIDKFEVINEPSLAAEQAATCRNWRVLRGLAASSHVGGHVNAWSR